MDWREYIEQNPQIMYGKAVLKGTRIPVDLIIEKLSLGEAFEDILEAYLTLNPASLALCFRKQATLACGLLIALTYFLR